MKYENFPCHRRFQPPRAFQVLAAALLVLVSGGLPSSAAGAPGPSTTLLESSPEGVRFRVSFPAPRAMPAGKERRLHWTGLRTGALPGEPALPHTRIRVAVPLAGPDAANRTDDLNLTVESVEGGRESAVQFPPVPVPGGRRLRTGPGAGNPSARILSVGIERGLRVATVAVYPVRWDPSTGNAVWSKEVTVTLGFPRSPSRAARSPKRDATGRESWERTLINPASAPGFRSQSSHPPAPPGGIPDSWFDKGQGWLKIHIEANGVYTLDRTALADAGVPVSTLDPRTFRLFAGSLVPEVAWAAAAWDTVEPGWNHVYERPGFSGGFADAGAMGQVAILVEGEGDGTFDGPDRVVFYALGPDNYRDRFGLRLGTAEDFLFNPYTDQTVYWLTWGGSFPDPPQRMQTVNAAPSGGVAANQSRARIHEERNRIYAPSLYDPGLRWERWYMELMNSFSNGNRFFISLPHLVPSSNVEAHIRLWGATVPTDAGSGEDELHHVQVDVNGEDAGLYKWGGGLFTTALTPQDVFVQGVAAQDPSDFFFRLPQVPSSDPTRFDQVYLAWIDVSYRKLHNLDGQSGELFLDTGTPGRTIRITAPPSGSLYVLDVSDFRQPESLGGFNIDTGGADPVLEFAYNSPDSAWIAVAGGSLLSPAALEMDDPPHPRPQDTEVRWLRDTQDPLDHVIIAHDDFALEAERLAEWRRQNLYPVTPGRPGRVRVVRISDIMDEFAWGMWDPAAVRHFLEYVFLYYGADTDDRLAYCLLLGDHTYDFRGFSGAASVDYVPSWEDNREDIELIGAGNVQYASDDPLARFDGLTDSITDLALGRITATSESEARTAVDKIVGQEQQPVFGPWRARALLVADDLCRQGIPDPSGSEFLATIEAVDGLLPRAYDRRKIYMVDYGTSCSILSKPEAGEDFLAAWNNGAWLINYVGHGDETFLSDENLIRITDLPQLENTGRYPVFVSTASKSGKFNQPTMQGFTESLVTLPGAGAVAAYGSASNQTFAAFAFDLNVDFIGALFPGGTPGARTPAGAALTEAKRFNPFDAAKYTFFGDPATRIPVPELALNLAYDDTLRRGDLETWSGTVAGLAQLSGDLELRVEGARVFRDIDVGYWDPGEVLFLGTNPVEADTAAGRFFVPASAATGSDARIRAYAWGTDWDALGGLAPLVVTGTANPAFDTQGPTVSLVGSPVRVSVGQELEALIEDPSGVRLASRSETPGVELIVTDPGQTVVFRMPLAESFDYESGSHTRGTARFPVPDLNDGTYTFTVNVYDNYDNLGSVSAPLEISSEATDAAFSNVYAFPNPLESETRLVFTIDRGAEVTIRIYAVSGRLVRREQLSATTGRNGFLWDGRDQAGDRVANGVYLVQLSAPGKDDPVRHLERVVVLR